MELGGAPKIVGSVSDFSVVSDGLTKGINAVVGITERGEEGKSNIYKTTWDYRRHLGGLLSDSSFPYMALRALSRGGIFRITPAGHYTDIADSSTLAGTKATGVIADGATGTGATAVVTITGAGTATKYLRVWLNDGNGNVQLLGTTTQSGSLTTTQLAAALVSDINSNTGAHGCTAANTANAVTITAPAAYGASVNNVWSTQNQSSGVVATNNQSFTGGVNPSTGTGSITIGAKSSGPWANAKARIDSVDSQQVGKMTLTFTLAGYPELTQVIEIAKNPTTEEKAIANSQLDNIILGAVTGTGIPVGYCYLSGGVRDNTAVVAADYIGSAVSKTGIHAFDDFNDCIRLAVPGIADPDLDYAMAVYVDARQDMAAFIETPLDISASVVSDYRNGTGTYSGNTPIDSWRSTLWTGGLKTRDTNKNIISHYGIMDVLACETVKDNILGVHFSSSIEQVGTIPDAIDVVRNFGNPSYATDFDLIYNNGVNAIIKDGSTVRLHGNKTLWKKPQLLGKLNNAMMVIGMFREIKPLVKSVHFQPNDPIMWEQLWKKITPVLDRAVTNRAIRPDYKYVGDQNVGDYTKATFNTQQDISDGKYKFRIYIKPISATEYIGFDIGVTSSSVTLETI